MKLTDKQLDQIRKANARKADGHKDSAVSHVRVLLDHVDELEKDAKRLDALENYLMQYVRDHHVMVWDREVKACLPSNRNGRRTLREAIDYRLELER